MKRFRNQKGNLTIEASLVLTTFTFFILFLFSFGRVYKAQNIVSHATIQCAQSLSVESYFRETLSNTNTGVVIKWISQLTGDSDITDSMLSLSEVNLGSVIKNNFITEIGKDETEANNILKNNGIKDGINGINFSRSKVDSDDIIVVAEYTVELQFPLFGKSELTLSKAAMSRSFKSLTYSVSVAANNPEYGDVSNSSHVEHGEQYTIKATPKPGYEFVEWSDGCKDQERQVSIFGTAKYVAIFRPIEGYDPEADSDN